MWRAISTVWLVALVSLAIPASARAQEGLPLAWSFASDDTRIRFTVQADDRIDDLTATVRRRADREDWEFSRSRVNPGETWEFEIPTYSRTSEYTLRIEGSFADLAGVIEDSFEVGTLAALDFDVRTETYDGDQHRFYMTMTQPADHVELLVRGDRGEVLAERTIPFHGEAPGTPLLVSWTPGAGTTLVIDVRAVAVGGAWASKQYVPWSVEVEVENTQFASGSAEIADSDRERLMGFHAQIMETATRVDEWVSVQLYVVGYTDTVGTAQDNQRLSEERARSLARFMRDQGFPYPIFYQGFGESVLAVETADNVDEAQNRRAIYIVTTQPPPGSTQVPGSSWHELD